MSVLDREDILTTTDGVDLNELWSDFQASLSEYNEGMDELVANLTFPTTQETLNVIQGAYDFEVYSDYTKPDAQDLTEAQISVPLNAYDLRIAYTVRKLLNTTSIEVEARHAEALAADTRLQLRQTLRAALSKEGVRGDGGVVAKAFYNADGTVPPAYKNNTFTGTHTHYLATTSAGLGAGITSLIDTIVEHGFENNVEILANRQTAKKIQALPEFVPVQGSVGSSLEIVGAPSDANVLGWYDGAIIRREDWLPNDYLFGYSAQGGANSPLNPMAFREPLNEQARGLVIMRGTNPEYPLANSYYYHEFGVGVRQRGNGAALQITSDGASYTSPQF